MFRHRPGPLAALAAAAVVPGAVLEAFGKASVAIGGTGHFALVSVAALVAGFASAGPARPGERRRRGRTGRRRRASERRPDRAARHGVLDDDRAARRARPRDAWRPRRPERGRRP